MASLKQTKNFKRIIDVYPLVGTGGWRENKKKQSSLLNQKRQQILHYESRL